MNRTYLIILLSLCISLLYRVDIGAQDKSSHAILMVLDVQEYFVDNLMSAEESDTYIEDINEIIRISRPMDIVFIQAYLKVLNISLKGILIDTVDDRSLEPSLYRKKNDMIFKKGQASAFTDSLLTDYLTQNNIQKIYLVGLLANDCIMATAIDGKKRGFEMVLIEEGIAAKNSSKHHKALHKFARKGIEVVDLEEYSLQ